MYSFAGIDSNNSYSLFSLGPAEGKGSYQDFLTLRQLSPKSKLVLSVGGWAEGGQKYSDMVSSEASRKSFIDSVIETMEKHPTFDGFDLDWEYPGATDRQGRFADKDNFLKLVRELKSRFNAYEQGELANCKHGRKLELSMAVPVAKFRLQEGYEVYELCQLMDFVNLMTYDLRGNWVGVSLLQQQQGSRPTILKPTNLNKTKTPSCRMLVRRRPHAAIPAAWLGRVGLRKVECQRRQQPVALAWVSETQTHCWHGLLRPHLYTWLGRLDFAQGAGEKMGHKRRRKGQFHWRERLFELL